MAESVLSPPTTIEWSNLATEEETELLDYLAESGRREIAVRLNALIEMFVKDPDVGRLDVGSFKSIAEFFKQNDTPTPAIVADYDGTLAVEWRLGPMLPHSEDQACDGILSLEFLPNGEIEYLGFVKATNDEEEVHYDGTAGQEEVIYEITSFLQRLRN